MFLIRFGCDPNWLLDLDMLAFSSLSDTVMRIHNQERVESAYRDRLIAHDDGTNFQKYLKGLARQAHGSDGDDLISDLTQTGGLQ